MEEIPSYLIEQIHQLFIPTLLHWKETDRNFHSDQAHYLCYEKIPPR